MQEYSRVNSSFRTEWPQDRMHSALDEALRRSLEFRFVRNICLAHALHDELHFSSVDPSATGRSRHHLSLPQRVQQLQSQVAHAYAFEHTDADRRSDGGGMRGCGERRQNQKQKQQQKEGGEEGGEQSATARG